ncbi:MAG: hypothetical protein JWR10_3715 [Rubritepida sp.]|nr:hypothetical protein [Rubritepida sp.]
MWPTFLAALLLTLPAPPASGRDNAPPSALDRAESGGELPGQAIRSVAPAPLEEDADGEEDRES